MTGCSSNVPRAYNPSIWNDNGKIQNSTNCYAYALNRRTGFEDDYKLQPGELAGTSINEKFSELLKGFTGKSADEYEKLYGDAVVEACKADATATNGCFSTKKTEFW